MRKSYMVHVDLSNKLTVLLAEKLTSLQTFLADENSWE